MRVRTQNSKKMTKFNDFLDITLIYEVGFPHIFPIVLYFFRLSVVFFVWTGGVTHLNINTSENRNILFRLLASRGLEIILRYGMGESV